MVGEAESEKLVGGAEGEMLVGEAESEKLVCDGAETEMKVEVVPLGGDELVVVVLPNAVIVLEVVHLGLVLEAGVVGEAESEKLVCDGAETEMKVVVVPLGGDELVVVVLPNAVIVLEVVVVVDVVLSVAVVAVVAVAMDGHTWVVGAERTAQHVLVLEVGWGPLTS